MEIFNLKTPKKTKEPIVAASADENRDETMAPKGVPVMSSTTAATAGTDLRVGSWVPLPEGLTRADLHMLTTPWPTVMAAPWTLG